MVIVIVKFKVKSKLKFQPHREYIMRMLLSYIFHIVEREMPKLIINKHQ